MANDRLQVLWED